MFERDTLYIGGQFVDSTGSGTIEVISPHTEEVIGHAPDGTTEDMDRAVAAARKAFDEGPWPRMSIEERLEKLTALSDKLNERAPEFANLITAEVGSPIQFSIIAQAYAAFMILGYYNGMAGQYPFEEVRQGMLGPVLVRKEPVGVVAAITPWNTPQFVTMSKIAPALVAGCTVVLKPAPETPLDAYLLAEVFEEVGFPEGVLNIVPAGREVGAHLVAHPGIDKVAFTGSTAAGKAIMAAAAENLTRVSLELGGKSAAILLPDTELDATFDKLLPYSFMNNGQACIAQTRILAPDSRYDEIVNALVGRVEAMKVGDPMSDETEIGPLIAERQRERVEKYIALGQEEGAEIATGGGRPAGMDTGWYVEPTVFAKVDNSMRIAQEEIFGPVVSVIRYRDEEDAIRIANDSTYGLSGTVWCADTEHGLDVARRIRTGNFGVNTFGMDFGSPFGGFKQSGLGREFGPEGLEEYLEHKTIHVPSEHELSTT
jgi:aldehyde dehydrogenase (NAD+)